MKLYTKTGDKGQTSLYDGSRISKGCAQIEVLGWADKLNAEIGVLLRSIYKEYIHIDTLIAIDSLVCIQRELMNFCTWFATTKPKSNLQKNQIKYLPDVTKLEHLIDIFQERAGPLTKFILPNNFAHVCRTSSRLLEHYFWKTGGSVDDTFMVWAKFLNRLSDYFFALSRSRLLGKSEITWDHGTLGLSTIKNIDLVKE